MERWNGGKSTKILKRGTAEDRFISLKRETPKTKENDRKKKKSEKSLYEKWDIDFAFIKNIVVLTSDLQDQLAVPQFVDFWLCQFQAWLFPFPTAIYRAIFPKKDKL